MSNTPTIKTPLKRAKGTGSAHQGGHHWLMERLTSIALVPLVIWFVASLISLVGSDHYDLLQFFSSPINAGLMALLVAFSFWHTSLGLTVVVEDYVHVKCTKVLALLVIKLGCFALGAFTLMAVAKIHFAF